MQRCLTHKELEPVHERPGRSVGENTILIVRVRQTSNLYGFC